MNHEKTTLEMIAPTIEEAVERGANQLGISKDELSVEVLDSGSKGLFGLGSRQARVRLTIKSADEPQSVTTAPVQKQEESQPGGKKPVPQPKAETKVETKVETKAKTEGDPVLQLAQEVVTDLLEKMHVQAEVTAKLTPPSDEHDRQMVLVEIQGRDLSILIGRRSETLNALQYITSLIVAKEHGEWIPLMIDVQGYRERREHQLRVLARRMAEQVVHTNRRLNMEPMPANERRVIHLELRDHELVETESVGEEPNRKVTIFLKRK